MRIVMSGKEIKMWIETEKTQPQIMIPRESFFQATKLTTIQDQMYYLVLTKNSKEVRLEPVQLLG